MQAPCSFAHQGRLIYVYNVFLQGFKEMDIGTDGLHPKHIKWILINLFL